VNKKVLGIAVVLLVVVVLSTPFVAEAMRRKSLIAVVGYNSEIETSEKECRGIIIRTAHSTEDLWLFGPEVVDKPATPEFEGLLPMVGGKSDLWVTQRFDPETGFGTFMAYGTLDFGEYGSFKIYGFGKCGGIIYAGGNPVVVAWYNQGDYYGYGKDALRGTTLKLIGSVQADLPDFTTLWPDTGPDQAGTFRVGEIAY
jgi:hypothetical protein